MTCECIAGSPYTKKQKGLTQLRELPSGDCAETEAALAAKEAALAEAVAKASEAEAKLAECEASKCPEATVMSLGNEVVFTGTSCETMTSIGGEDVATPAPLESETVAELDRG